MIGDRRPTGGNSAMMGLGPLLAGTALAAFAPVAEAAPPAGSCLVEKVNKNGQSIGNPSCPDRGSLSRLAGDKSRQFFLVRSTRAPDGTFSLQSTNGQFDTGQFVLDDGRLRMFVSNASGQEPHELYNFDADDGDGGDGGGGDGDGGDGGGGDGGGGDGGGGDGGGGDGGGGDGGGGDGGGGDGGGGDGGGGDGGDGGGGDGGDGGGGDGGGGDGGGGGGGDGGGGSGGGGTGGGGGGDGGGGDGGGGTGGGGGSAAGPKTDRGTEQAVTGSGALPVFTDPYTITERLVGWGFGAPGGTPVTPTPDGKERRGWFQGRSSTFDFDGSGRDSGGHRNEAIVGFDVVRRPDLVYGLAAGWEDGHADSFGGQVDSRFDGYFFGPYVGWKPDPDLVLDLWVGYARRDFSNSIAGFDSDFDVNRVFVSANATGRYLRGDYELRPKLELFYANDDIPDHSYSNGGSRFGVVGGHDDEMVSTLSGEVRREHVTSGGTRIAPYFRVGIDAWLARPNDGLLLDGDLNEFSMSAITGDLRAGVNAAFLNGGRFDARVGYGGIGEDGLEIVEGEIALSIPF